MTIQPLGTTTTTALGTGTGTLSLSQTALNNITASTLIFGGTGSSGAMSVGGAVTVPTTITNLSLLSGGAVNIGSGASLANNNSNGTVTLQGGSLSIAGGVTVNTGTNATLVLDTTGTATQSAALTATNLLLSSSGGTYTLTNTSNNVGTLAASIGSGTVSLYDNGNLAIGQVGSTSGVTAGTLTLTLPSGDTATQSAPISGNLDLLGTGAVYTLNGSSNSVGTLAANTGSVNLLNGSALTIGTAGGTTGVTTTGAFTLNVSGTISDPTAAVSVGAFILSGGNWSQVGTLASFTDSGDFELNNGSTFLRASGGLGTPTSPYQLTDVYGLQGIEGFLSDSFVLENTINASGTSTWNPQGGGVYAGFVPIGGFAGWFAGSLNGQGNTISGLTIDMPGSGQVGLFGIIGSNAATAVQNLNLTGLNITGNQYVGGLAGYLYFGNISSVSVAGQVNGVGGGSQYVGGLVGLMGGNIANSSSSVTVTGSNDSASGSVGGLVGYLNGGEVSKSYATGNVTGYTDVGGLVGQINSGGALTVYQSYATGTVTATAGTIPGNLSGGVAGGLAGYLNGGIAQSFATGKVTGYNDAGLGGLVGENAGSIVDSYATGSVTQTNFGGGNPNGTGSVGGLVGFEEGTITNTYATGSVSGSNPGGVDIGGLVGTDFGSAGTITQSYFDTQATGTQTGIGLSFSNFGAATGETTATLQAALPAGFNTTATGGCASCWGIEPGVTYPLFVWQPGVVSGEVFNTYNGSTVGPGVTVSDVINGTIEVLDDHHGGRQLPLLFWRRWSSVGHPGAGLYEQRHQLSAKRLRFGHRAQHLQRLPKREHGGLELYQPCQRREQRDQRRDQYGSK